MSKENCSDIAAPPSTAMLERARMLLEVCKNTGYPLSEPVSPELRRAIEQVQAEQQATN